MNKRLAALMAVVCLAFFIGDAITSQAAVNAPSKTCVCGAIMVQHGQHLTQWTDTHEVEVIHKDAKGTVTSVEIITCTRSHDLNRTFYTCPSCGKSEQKDYDTVRHTCSYCSTQELPY